MANKDWNKIVVDGREVQPCKKEKLEKRLTAKEVDDLLKLGEAAGKKLAEKVRSDS